MDITKKTLTFAIPMAMLVSFASGFLICDHSQRDPKTTLAIEQDWRERDLLQNFDFVQDALTRWASKNQTTEEQILERWSPQAMPFLDRDCVQFVTRQPDIGGPPPVYCYGNDNSGAATTQLIYEEAELGE